MEQPNLALRVVAHDDPAFPAMMRLWAAAYPVMEANDAETLAREERRYRARAQDPDTRVVIAERDGDLAGVMAIYDYTMNLRGRDASVSGLGAVAVSLAHKRRGVANALVRWYLHDARERGVALGALYPFRPEFYRKMGFGYGTPSHRFRFDPATLDARGARGRARMLGEADAGAMLACQERMRARVNGMFNLSEPWLRRVLADLSVRYVGIEDGGTIVAWAQLTTELGPPGTANRNALVVRDVVFDDPSALASLAAFLRDQRDQYAQIVVETQDDCGFLLSSDPRDGSDILVGPPAVHRVAETGLGIMYRILDVPRAFASLSPVDTPFVLRVEVEDMFEPAAGGAWAFRFGRYTGPQHDDAALPDATLRIGIADLSSLLTGSLDLRPLVRYRLAALEPAAMLDRVERAFRPDQRPITHRRF